MPPRDRTIPERMTAMETTNGFFDKRLDTIETKLDILIEAQNKRQGMARVGHLALNAASAIAGALAGIHWGR